MNDMEVAESNSNWKLLNSRCAHAQ